MAKCLNHLILWVFNEFPLQHDKLSKFDGKRLIACLEKSWFFVSSR